MIHESHKWCWQRVGEWSGFKTDPCPCDWL